MEIKLSPRLLECCRYVTEGARVADVGCDHGYTSIFLLKSGIASRVYACDVKEGPLQSAVINAEKYGVRDAISFYLSDGVRSVPRDFDTLICAGMGADVMVSILEAAPWLQSKNYHLILQCQSKTPTLRKYLSNHGWRIRKESVVKDGRFLYSVMDIVFERETLSDAQTYLSPALLAVPGENTVQYCRHVLKQLRLSAEGQKDAHLLCILQELKETLPQWAKEETP